MLNRVSLPLPLSVGETVHQEVTLTFLHVGLTPRPSQFQFLLTKSIVFYSSTENKDKFDVMRQKRGK